MLIKDLLTEAKALNKTIKLKGGAVVLLDEEQKLYHLDFSKVTWDFEMLSKAFVIFDDQESGLLSADSPKKLLEAISYALDELPFHTVGSTRKFTKAFKNCYMMYLQTIQEAINKLQDLV